MITCKLCGTELGLRMKRKDGSMLCPVCGQIYWKSAVEKADLSNNHNNHTPEEIKDKYRRESRKSVEFLRHARLA